MILPEEIVHHLETYSSGIWKRKDRIPGVRELRFSEQHEQGDMVFGQATEPTVLGPDVLTVENRLRAGYRLMTDPTPPSDIRELEL